jgi:hypothetical protein
MINFPCWCVLAALIYYSAGISFAQSTDAGIWLKATVRKKYSSRFSNEFAVSGRFSANMMETETFYLQPSAEYKLNRYFKIGAGLRYGSKRESDPEFSHRYRFFCSLTSGKKFYRRIKLQYRLMFQQQYHDIGRSENALNAEQYIRNKLEISVNTDKKYQPFVYAELFYHSTYRENGFNRMRYAGGISYPSNKHHSVSIYYMLQKQINVPDPEMSHIMSIAYRWTI